MRETSVLILHNIRSTYNVGAIMRTADAAGIRKVYMTGYTPTPLDRFGRPRADIAKAALGAETTLPWESQKNIATLLSALKREGYAIVGLEQDKRAVDYKTFVPEKPTALVLGNEVRGLSRSLRDKCDALVEIPMKGKKESLNVSVAAGIVLFRLLDR